MTIFKSLKIEPDSFPNDPLGWAGNQAGHLMIAAMFAFWVAFAWFSFFEEYPYKIVLFMALSVAYLSLELPQGGGLLDTLEDILVVLGYGGGLFIMSFDEISVGSSVTHFDLVGAVPLISMMTAHFAAGMIFRFWQMTRLKNDE